LRQVFLVHGEPQQSAALANALRSSYQLQAQAPAPGQAFYLTAAADTSG
jgi:predicted metal-dependent RNase